MGITTSLIQHDYVQKLKQNQTPSELKLKKILSSLARDVFLPLTYFKQAPFKHDKGFYIVDFYLPALRIGFEVDGGYHLGKIDEDLQRDYFFMSKGVTLYHFPNQFFHRKKSLQKLGVISIIAYIIAEHLNRPFNIPNYLKPYFQESDNLYFKVKTECKNTLSIPLFVCPKCLKEQTESELLILKVPAYPTGIHLQGRCSYCNTFIKHLSKTFKKTILSCGGVRRGFLFLRGKI